VSGASGELRAVGSLSVLDGRPAPSEPREYHFPAFTRQRLDNGLTVLAADLPGRPLLMAQLLLEGGAGAEPTDLAGVTSLAARAFTEGTRQRDALELIEAAERLGAELHAEAGWEVLSLSVEVPRSRFEPALALLAETALEPSFPEREVERLREERLNDLLQGLAEPRRRAERAFNETIYAPSSPFSRPAGGSEETVERLDRGAVAARHAAILAPESTTLIVAGDLRGIDVPGLAAGSLGHWREGVPRSEPRAHLDATPHPAGPRAVLIDRPGSAQTEIRVGHVGLRRRIDDFHAVAAMAAVLGGLFNSRLQRLLREERGYTYGVNAGFEFRRSAGPFATRTAVQTEVTGPAVGDILSELRRIGEAPIEERELVEARDYLIGVFPLRFEAAAQVVAALSGLVIFELPDDELDRYRPSVAAVTLDDIRAATRHVRPDDLSVVLVGDAANVEGQLASVWEGTLEIVREPLETPSEEEVVLGPAAEEE
jgi:predicted Zn-dependent peptidase